METIENEIAAPYVRLHPDESPLTMSRHVLEMQSNSTISSPVPAPAATPSEIYMRKRKISKYTSALRTLIPFRRTIRQTTRLPLDSNGYFSLVSFSWVTKFLRNPLPNESLSTAELDSSHINGQRLKDFLADENIKRGQVNARMVHIIWQFVKTRIIISSTIYLLSCAMYIIGLVFFLTWFLQTGEIQNLLVLVLMFSFSLLLKFWSSSISFRTANRLQSAFMSLMYKHLLQVSILHSISAHRIVTTMAADSQKVHEAIMCLPEVLATPLVLLLPVPMLLMKMDCYTVHDSAFAILTCLLITPILFLLARLSNVWKSRMLVFTNKRLISLQELLLHIPLVKMTLREKLFHRNAQDLRKSECQYMNKVNLCDGFTVSFLHTVPLVVIVLLWHQQDDTNMRMEIIKCKEANLISLIILMLIPFKELLFGFWQGTIKIFEGLMAFTRLKCVLVLDCVSKQVPRKPINHLIAVSVSEATFVVKVPFSDLGDSLRRSRRCACFSCHGHNGDDVEMQSKSVLQDINFAAPKGKIIGICGDTFSGKTALMMALLGQINHEYGGDKLVRDGLCAYVGQNPWVMDATLRENILFNEMFIHKRYYHVIHCCSLNDDIGHLPGGDQTLISDTSLTLGQKQQIALARALYANRDIYILDEFLSAVSADIGTIIFERAIQNHLKGKTIILSTRQAKFLKHCDEIFVLKDGKVEEQGNHSTLMEKELYSQLIRSYIQEESNRYMENQKTFQTNINITPTENSLGTFIPAESIIRIPDTMEEEHDEESLDMVVKYNDSVGFFRTLALETESSILLIIALIFRIICVVAILTSPLFVLKHLKLDTTRYIIMGFFLTILLTRIIGIISFDKVTYNISLYVHQNWIENISKGCLNIFQSASHSEILRWFSLHLSEIDTNIPSSSITLVENLFLTMLLFIVLSICSCWFLIPIFAVCVIFHFLLRFAKFALTKFYIRADEACLSLNGFVTSTVMGRVTIQAFGKEYDFLNGFHNQCDSFLAYSQLCQAASQWLSFWTQIISLSFVMIILGTLCIENEMKSWLFLFHREDYQSLINITIFCVFLLGFTLNSIAQISATISSKIVVLGNQDATVRSIKPEEESNLYIAPQSLLNSSIEFQNVKLEGWSNSQPLWKGLSFEISSGERIGILGLPGSGKSAIVGALYKLANIHQGSVTIGGIDIKTIPVNEVRSNIAIIPKNPLMFSGSLRMNLDPMHRHGIRELCECLEKVGLPKNKDLLTFLDTEASQIEEELTVQERQLLYVAQASLRDPKVVILEEPIEPIDVKDIFKVQDAVEAIFHSTVLVISQSVKYVTKCDKIMFLKDGQVAEFDTPTNLFRNPDSNLSQMFSASTENLLETEV